MNNVTNTVVELNVSDILPNRYQARINSTEQDIIELSESIKAHGIIQPIVVRPLGKKYEIIIGERRYKASIYAGKQTIPAFVVNTTDKESVEMALLENIQRKDLTPIEEAISYKRVLDIGNLTQEQLANKIGKSQPSIANKIRLLNLSDKVQEALLENKISERHARSLLKLKSIKSQETLLNRIIEERLTVKKTDEEIDKMNNEANNFFNLNNMGNNGAVPGTEQNTGVSNVSAAQQPLGAVQNATEGLEMVDLGSLFSNVQQPAAAPTPAPFEVPQEAFPQNSMTEEAIAQPAVAPTVTTNPFETVSTPAAPTPAPFEVPQEAFPQNSMTEEVMAQPAVAPAVTTNPFETVSTPVAPIGDLNTAQPITFESAPLAPQPEPTTIETSFAQTPDFNSAVNNQNQPLPMFNNEDNTVGFGPFPSIETPISEPISAPQVNGFEVSNPVNPLDTIPQTQTIPSFQAPTPDTPIIDNSLGQQVSSENNQMAENMLPQEPIIITDYNKQYDPVMPETNVNQGPTISFKEVIDLIRNCTKQIEQYGYKIDTDEFDLQDSYQVIFKIDKE